MLMRPAITGYASIPLFESRSRGWTRLLDGSIFATVVMLQQPVSYLRRQLFSAVVA
jgi:hypothetical protein